MSWTHTSPSASTGFTTATSRAATRAREPRLSPLGGPSSVPDDVCIARRPPAMLGEAGAVRGPPGDASTGAPSG